MYPLLYRRRARTCFCAGLIGFALLLRLAMLPGLPRLALRRAERALGSELLFRAVLFLQTGVTELPAASFAGPQEAEDRGSPAAEAPAATAAAPAETPRTGEELLPFTAAEAEKITLRGNCTYPADKAALLTAPLGWTVTPGPKVLILHTHASEAYTPSPGLDYEASGDHRTLEADRSVVAVGDELAKQLEALGAACVHDRGFHDYPNYNRSYADARSAAKELLARYPSIVMIVDLHRDALEKPVRETVELAGVTAAPLMLVSGTDQGGLEHPDWARNLSCALKLQALLERENPGLCKALSFRRERFNGDLSPGALIVEVGSTENTLPEALASMPALARAVSELLQLAEQEAGDNSE